MEGHLWIIGYNAEGALFAWLDTLIYYFIFNIYLYIYLYIYFYICYSHSFILFIMKSIFMTIFEYLGENDEKIYVVKRHDKTFTIMLEE